MSDSDIFERPEPRRSQSWVWLVLILAGGAMLVLFVIGTAAVVLLNRVPSLPPVPSLPSVSAKSQVVSASDKACRVTIPGDWTEVPDVPNPLSRLLVRDKSGHSCLMVATESKADFDEMTLARYADITSNIIASGLRNAHRSPPVERQLQGRPVLEYRLDGTLNNVNLVYWHTTIEGRDHYFQVVTWTLRSQARQNEAVLRDVARTFQETPKTGHAPPAEAP